MDQSDKIKLEACLNEVVKESGLGDLSKWTIREYEHLSEQIEEKTRIRISTSTLRRLFKGMGISRPQPSTLNALAQFINYNDWFDFVKRSSEINTEDRRNVSKRISRQRFFIPRYRGRIWWFLGFIILLVALILWLTGLDNKTRAFTEVPLVVSFALDSGIPNTVIYHYNLDSIEFDTAYIDLQRKNYPKYPVKKGSSQFAQVYYYPGSYATKLVIDGNEVTESRFILYTDGWQAFARRSLDDIRPVYLDLEGADYSKLLYVSAEQIAQKGIDISQLYITNYEKCMDFGNIDCDNFRVKTRLRSSLEEGGQICQHAWLIINGEKDYHWVSIVDPGCVGIVDIKFSERMILGHKHDLSKLGCDLNEWHDIEMIVQDRKVQVWLDGNEVYQTEYEHSIGKLIGLNIQFLGTGSVDFVGLYNEKNQAVLEEGSL